MAKYFWLSHENNTGGRCEQKQMPFMYQGGGAVCTMREYMKAWRQGYDMDWTSPEWIQDVFPADQK